MLFRNNQVRHLDPIRALILASTETSQSMRDLLEPYGIECVTPQPTEGSSDFHWLCSVLFGTSEAQADAPEVRLFAWNRFDVVILQDLWAIPYSGRSERLEFAGRVFASWDNDRGNFNTKKIVLVTDPEFFERRAMEHWDRTADPGARLEAQRLFAPKGSIEFISLFDKVAGVSTRLVDAVLEHSSGNLRTTPSAETSHSSASSPETIAALNDSIRRGITSPVVEAAAASLRSTLPSGTRILLIEDEESALDVAYRALTGKEIDPPPDKIPTPWVNIAPITIGADFAGTRRGARNFLDLLNQCDEEIRESLKAGSGVKDLIVITDILFENAGVSKTGIDLIRELRNAHANYIRIIAFTGFRTPFVAMSAYHQGADFVVDKGGFGGHHDTLQLAGTDRLLQALSLLSFQRDYLRRVRERCIETMGNVGNGSISDIEELAGMIEEFEHTMPRHTLSPHLQQEWEDTLYILKLFQVHKDPSNRDLIKEVIALSRKHAHA